MINTSYLTDKFKGKYRLKVPINKATNDFSRKLNGSYEDIDMFIECQYGNKIFHYGGSILQAYIPSLIRGHNIIKAIVGLEKFNTIYSGINENTPQYIGENGQKTSIKEQFHGDIIFDIEETDSEILFKFNYKDSDNIIPLLKPKTNGANISPFSSKNLPRNKDYKIPDEEFSTYKEIVAKIPSERILTLTHSTKHYLKSLVTKKNTWDDIRADMKLKGLKGKEYIHSIGKWDEYIEYLRKEISECQM